MKNGKKNRNLIFSILLLITILFISCQSTKTEIEIVAEENQFSSLELQIEKMSLEEKIGQLFVIRPDSIDPDLTPEEIEMNFSSGVTSVSDGMLKDYEKYPAGGFVLFRKNIKAPQQVLDFNNSLRSLGKIKPLIFIDEEGGIVARLAENPKFNLPEYENMGIISKNKNPDDIYEVGKTIGKYLKQYGFDVDFAPVADVNTNPKNPVIGNRAFSPDPETAGKMCVAFTQGLHSQGVGGCYKHFPGHGDTSTDTHKGYAETAKNWNELKQCEMIPFIEGINNGIQMIMSAHITVPEVEKELLPSTLSKALLTDKLRNELGFKGIIITDAMEMGAIKKHYSSGEAAILAIQAGADIILMPYDYREAFEAVVEAVKDKKIQETRIDESLRRILLFKEKYK